MATKIRLKRIGRRNRPFYRLIIIDSRKRRDGLAIEQVGWYDPLKKDKKVEKRPIPSSKGQLERSLEHTR